MTDIKEITNLIDGGISNEDQALIERAYKFAEKAHENQKRKSGEPYFIHCVETAKILAKQGMDAKTIASGLMHDVLEDTEVTEEEMEKEFGEEIVFLVKGVTKLGALKYTGYDRHVESLRKFFIAMANDLRVVIIKFADRLHNLRTLEYVKEEKRHRIALESIDIYAPLANRLGMGKLKGEIEEAAFPYAFPKEYEKIKETIEEHQGEYEHNLALIKLTLDRKLKEVGVNFSELSHRVKTKYSLWKKMQRYNNDIEKIYDVIALRVVVDTVEDCYQVLGIVHSIWKPVLGRVKDYISLPKPNGYRSLHTTIFTGENGFAEIQIRTKEMHAEAAYGIAAHFIYKENSKQKKKTNDNLKFTWLEELTKLNYSPNEPKAFFENLKTDFFNDRIFILTPKGDVVDLPRDSCAIDFAYAIHSDIGEHVGGVLINTKMSQIFTPLKNGDIVEIITKNDAHPSNKWLEHVQTSMAKKHIKSYLERNSLLAKLKSFRSS